MNLYKIYHDICNRGHERGTKKSKGFELHHILPKSMNGTNDPSNLALLTPKEHYVVHHCLARTGNKKMIYAFKMMTDTRNFKLTSKQYEKLRILHSENVKNQFLGLKLTLEHKQKIGNAHRGMKRSSEACKNISDSQKGKFLSVEHKDKIKKSLQGQKRGCYSDAHKLKISESGAYRYHCKQIELDEFIFPEVTNGN